MGAETIRPRIAQLIPGVSFLKRERFSDLRYTGPKKISRMPARSAIVGFSVDDVYAIAEVIRLPPSKNTGLRQSQNSFGATRI